MLSVTPSRSRCRWWIAASAVVLVAACGEDDARTVQSNRSAALTAAGLTTLNTYIGNNFVEIDADANLVTGQDPADGTASTQQPGPSSGPFTDWNALGTVTGTNLTADNFQVLDSPTASTDPTAFPGSNACVGPGNVLDKMNITYVAAASNDQFAYFGVQRAGNNGDAAWYWLLTKKRPLLCPDANNPDCTALGTTSQQLGPCKSTQQYLRYAITGGSSGARDVLIVGHFVGGTGTPVARVFLAASSPAAPLDAVSAIDFTNAALWTEQTSSGIVSSTNSTMTAPGSFFGAAGVKNMVTDAHGNPALGPNLFAEAAIPLTLLGGAGCGATPTYYGSVISRSSGSGGTSPDLKDLAGPAYFTFGKPSAAGSLTPTCGRTFDYAVDTSIGATSCTWKITNTTTSTSYRVTGCSGTFDTAATSVLVWNDDTTATPVYGTPGTGAYTAQLSIIASVAGCSSNLASAGAANAYDALSASPALTTPDVCTSTFHYGAGTVAGGSGTYSYAWTFSPSAKITSPSPATSTAASGDVSVNAKDTYSATLTVTDAGRTDSKTCAVTPTLGTVDVYLPVSLTLSLATNPTQLSCSTTYSSPAVTFNTSVSGGSGSVEYHWSGTGGLTTAAAGCGTSAASCSVQEPDATLCATDTVSVYVTDATCGSTSSKTGTYKKATTIDASVP